MDLSLKIFKPNLFFLICSNIIDSKLKVHTNNIIERIVSSNQKAKKYFSTHISILSYISYNLVNNIFIKYYSSSLTDSLFNLLKISIYNNKLPISSVKFFSFSKIGYTLTKFIEPLALEKLKCSHLGKFIFQGFKFINIGLKLLYILNEDFFYTDLVDFIFGIVTINKGKPNSINIYLSFIYFFIIIINSCYKKIKKKDIKDEMNRKQIIKIINEKIKDEVLPSPYLKYRLIKNKNFSQIVNNRKGKCLLCNQIFKIPTAIKCCGGVFCYKCIVEYIDINYKCYLCCQSYSSMENIKSKILIKIYS